MDPAYGARYRELHERHWWWRAREAVVLRELDRLRPPAGWRRALDVGCGDGLLLDRLRRYADHVEGLEPDEAIVSEERRREGVIHLRPFDGTFRPDEPYDLILFLDVLEHIDAVESAIAHAGSLLAPDGHVLVTVPAFPHLWTTHDELNRHVRRYSKRELVRQLSIAFEVVEARHLFRWVHAAKLAQRALERARRPDPAPPRVPPAPLNALLYGLSRAEEALLARVPLPIGSSLLAVARNRRR